MLRRTFYSHISGSISLPILKKEQNTFKRTILSITSELGGGDMCYDGGCIFFCVS